MKRKKPKGIKFLKPTLKIRSLKKPFSIVVEVVVGIITETVLVMVAVAVG